MKELYSAENLVPIQADQIESLTASWGKRKIIIVVIAVGSSLIGETIRQIRFRSTYGAVVIALHSKQDASIDGGCLENHAICAGDSFLMECDPWCHHPLGWFCVCISQQACCFVGVTLKLTRHWNWCCYSVVITTIYCHATCSASQ